MAYVHTVDVRLNRCTGATEADVVALPTERASDASEVRGEQFARRAPTAMAPVDVRLNGCTGATETAVDVRLNSCTGAAGAVADALQTL